MSRADWMRLTGDDRVSDLVVWLQQDAHDGERSKTPARGESGNAPAGTPSDDAAGVIAALRKSAPADSPIEVSTSGQLRAVSLRIFDRSFAVTRWLQGVALAIGLAGIAASFSAQVLARRREFGTLQHLGFTRRQVLTLVSAEGALWSAVGAVLGLALGLAVSVVLVKIVNPQSFHWTMQMSVPDRDAAGAGRGRRDRGRAHGLGQRPRGSEPRRGARRQGGLVMRRRPFIAAMLPAVAAERVGSSNADTRGRDRARRAPLPDHAAADRRHRARADAPPRRSAYRHRALRFPADHAAHPDTHVEWWYVTGWLRTASSADASEAGAASRIDKPPEFGFQVTFFRTRTGFGEDVREPVRGAPVGVRARRADRPRRDRERCRPDTRPARRARGLRLRADARRERHAGRPVARLVAEPRGDTARRRAVAECVAHRRPQRPLRARARVAGHRRSHCCLQGDAGYSRRRAR